MKKEYAQSLLDKTKKDYNLIADDFSSTRGFIWGEMRFLFDEYLKAGEKILDVGCGNARCFPLFREKGVDYYGVDNSEKLINIARDKYPEGNFQMGDVLNIPFSGNNFDRVYSIAVLHHIPSKELRISAMREAKRVLKKDGLFVLTVWNFHQFKEIWQLIKYSVLKIFRLTKLDWKDVFEPWGNKAERYYHCFSQRELKRLAFQAGLEVQKIGLVKNQKGNRQNFYLVAKKIEN